MSYESRTGNTLAEYGFLIGGFTLLAIGSVLMLGQSLSGLFTQASSSASQYATVSFLGSATPASATPGATGNSPPASNSNSLSSATGSPGAINGLVNGLSPVAVNVSSVDGTGVVKANADTLTKLARQIQSDPGHDPGVLALVTQLATDGHTAASNMASGLNPYKEAIQSGSSLTLMTPEITNAVNASASFKSTQQQLADYLQTHPGALSPDMAAAVQTASQNALGILGTLVNVNAQTDNDKVNSAGWYNLANQSLTVHQDSNTICRNGGDTTTCVQ